MKDRKLKLAVLEITLTWGVLCWIVAYIGLRLEEDILNLNFPKISFPFNVLLWFIELSNITTILIFKWISSLFRMFFAEGLGISAFLIIGLMIQALLYGILGVLIGRLIVWVRMKT